MEEYEQDLGGYDGLGPSADDRWAQWRAHEIRQESGMVTPLPHCACKDVH
jgi:hypothetical protein